jgi:hypothetical protein
MRRFRAIPVAALAFVIPLALAPHAWTSQTCAAYPRSNWTFSEASALQFDQLWLDILQQKNTAALECMLAPEFKDTSREGALRPKAQVLRELDSRKQPNDYHQTLAELQADLFGDTAVVHGVNVISDLQGHQVLRIRFTDVLHFSHGRWLAVAAQETDVH